jgi:hypothetical protein
METKIYDSGKTNTSNKSAAQIKKEQFLDELAKKYPEGITTENIDGVNCKIVRIIIVKDHSANEYKKIIYSYGTFYKKNDQDITEQVFKNETKPN